MYLKITLKTLHKKVLLSFLSLFNVVHIYLLITFVLLPGKGIILYMILSTFASICDQIQLV